MTQFASSPTNFKKTKINLWGWNIPKESIGPTASPLLIKESLLQIPKFHGTKKFWRQFCFDIRFCYKIPERLLFEFGIEYYICHDKGIRCCYFLHSQLFFVSREKKQVMEDYGLARSENVPWLKGFPCKTKAGEGRFEGFNTTRVLHF